MQPCLRKVLGMLATLLEQQNLKQTTQRSRNLDSEKAPSGGCGGRGWRGGCGGSRRRDGQEAGIRMSISRYAGGDLEW